MVSTVDELLAEPGAALCLDPGPAGRAAGKPFWEDSLAAHPKSWEHNRRLRAALTTPEPGRQRPISTEDTACAPRRAAQCAGCVWGRLATSLVRLWWFFYVQSVLKVATLL